MLTMLILTTYLSGSIIAEGGTLEPVDHTDLYDVIVDSAACNDLLIITHIKAPIQAWLEWAFNIAVGNSILYTEELIQRSAAILIDVHPAIVNISDVAALAKAHRNGLIHFYWVATERMASTQAIRTDLLEDPEYQENSRLPIAWQHAPQLF